MGLGFGVTVLGSGAWGLTRGSGFIQRVGLEH